MELCYQSEQHGVSPLRSGSPLFYTKAHDLFNRKKSHTRDPPDVRKGPRPLRRSDGPTAMGGRVVSCFISPARWYQLISNKPYLTQRVKRREKILVKKISSVECMHIH